MTINGEGRGGRALGNEWGDRKLEGKAMIGMGGWLKIRRRGYGRGWGMEVAGYWQARLGLGLGNGWVAGNWEVRLW